MSRYQRRAARQPTPQPSRFELAAEKIGAALHKAPELIAKIPAAIGHLAQDVVAGAAAVAQVKAAVHDPLAAAAVLAAAPPAAPKRKRKKKKAAKKRATGQAA